MSDKVYEGSTGVEILIDMGQDISDATVHSILVRKDGAEETWDAEVYTSDTTYLRYVISTALVVGTYYLHPLITLGDFAGYCEWVSFVVSKKWR